MELEEPVFLPLNAPDARTVGVNYNDQTINARDLHYLKYNRLVPGWLKRIIEFGFLLMAFISLFVIVYAHMNFSQKPATCLDHVKDNWPRDGILRVEIIQSYQRTLAEQTGTLDELFTLEKSYEREYKLKQFEMNDENFSMFLNPITKINNPESKEDIDIEPSPKELDGNTCRETDEKKETFSSSTKKPNRDEGKSNLPHTDIAAQLCSNEYPDNCTEEIKEMRSNLLPPNINPTSSPTEENEDIFFENYIVEYSLKKSFLSLSPNDRSQLGIPITYIPLEPTRHKCFGDSVDQFFLDNFLGYDNLLMSSVKSLDDNEQMKGYLRNVITDKHHRLESIKRGRTSYITSFFVMVIFTVSISIFLRHSDYQVGVFMVNLRERGVLDVYSIVFFATRLFINLVLVLFGMRYIMSTFFNDGTTALYVIIIVWLADQYDNLFSHCPTSKKHWRKFFYLYHFLLYAYHYRFNGQFKNLNLICSWLFTEHSMIYFFHHFELPYVLQQPHLQQIIQTQQQHQHQHQPSDTSGGENAHQLDTGNPVEVAEADVEFQRTG